MPAPLAAVLFDLDGTLVDTFAVCYLAFRRAVAGGGGPPLSDTEIHALFGPSEDGMMQRVLPHGLDKALELYFDEYERLLPTCPAVIPELASALALLRPRRILTGLVTGKTRVTAAMSSGRRCQGEGDSGSARAVAARARAGDLCW